MSFHHQYLQNRSHRHHPRWMVRRSGEKHCQALEAFFVGPPTFWQVLLFDEEDDDDHHHHRYDDGDGDDADQSISGSVLRRTS